MPMGQLLLHLTIHLCLLTHIAYESLSIVKLSKEDDSYKGKFNGFVKEGVYEIIFYAEDRGNVSNWQKAVEADGLIWKSQVMGDTENKISIMYGVKYIPMNYLIDGLSGQKAHAYFKEAILNKLLVLSFLFSSVSVKDANTNCL